MSILERIKGLLGHRLVRSTMVLQVGGIVGTLVQAAAGVFMARLLQPELYGKYALAFSVAAISSVFIGGGLTDAIAPAVSRAWARGDGQDLRRSIGFYVRFLTAGALAMLAVILLLPMITAQLYHDPLVGGYAGVIVLASIVSTSVGRLTQLTLQVAGRMRTLAALTLTDVVMRYGVMLALVAGGFGVWGAVTGHLIGALVLFVVASVIYVRLEKHEPLVPALRRLPALARQTPWRPLLGPTLWVLADSNFAILYGALPVALVGLHASGTELAYFKLAFGYIILAMSVMGPVSTVMNVHFPTVQTTSPDELRKTFVRVTLSAVALSTAITAVVLLISPLVFRILYGAVYVPAVRYVYGFGVFGALFGLGVGLGPMWRSLGRVHVSIVINLITLAIGVPLGLWLVAHWHLWGAVVMVTLWYTVSHAVSFIYLLFALKSND